VTSAPLGETVLWDAARGRIERRFPIGGQFGVSPDGRFAALARNSPNPGEPTTSLVELDLRSGDVRKLDPPPSPTWLMAIAYTGEGHRIVGASFDLALRVWDVESGSILQTFTGQPSGQNLAILPDDKTVVSGADTGSVAAWDLSGEQQLSKAFAWNTPETSCSDTPCFVVNPQSTVMATNQAGGTVALVDLRDHELIDTLPARSGAESDALAFFPDGRRLAVGGLNGRLNLWDLRTREVERTLRYDDPVYWAAVSPDGELLAVETQADGSPDARVEVRDLAADEVLYSRPVPHGRGSLYFSPDGERLAAVGCCQDGSTVEVWDARSGAKEYSPELDGLANSLSFSPDSSLLAVGTDDGKVALFDTADGTPEGAAIQAATGAIDPVSFSPDGSQFAASSEDQTATLWDVETHKQIGESFPQRQGTIPTAQFAPDGSLVIYELANAIAWPMDPEVWRDFACRAAGRDLTEAEWQDLLPDRPYQPTCPR
jgi:WD40 repeat protein